MSPTQALDEDHSPREAQGRNARYSQLRLCGRPLLTPDCTSTPSSPRVHSVTLNKPLT